MKFAGIGENFFHNRVFVVRIVVVKGNLFHAAINRGLDRLLPAAVSPADMFGQFFGRILRVDDEEVGAFSQDLQVLVAPVRTVFDVGAVGDDLVVLHDPVAYTALGVV